MRKEFKKGQSILEYTLLLGVVISVIVAVLLSNGGIKANIQASYDKTGQALTQTTNDLTAGVFK